MPLTRLTSFMSSEANQCRWDACGGFSGGCSEGSNVSAYTPTPESDLSLQAAQCQILAAHVSKCVIHIQATLHDQSQMGFPSAGADVSTMNRSSSSFELPTYAQLS